MTAILVKSVKSDSELVIGQKVETAHSEVEKENRLILQVWNRTELLKTKRSNFTPAEYRIKLQGEHALETLLKIHNARICALVLEHQSSGGSANEDLKQESVAAFIEAIARFDPNKGAELWTYAYTWVRAKLQTVTGRDNRNQIATAKALFEPEACETPEIVDSYELDRLNDAIGQLSENEQRVIQLRNQDIPFAEIAQIFGRSIKRIQNLYYEARRRLRSLLGFIDPVTEKPETIEQIAVEATVQESFEQKRVVFRDEPITISSRSETSWFAKVGCWFSAIKLVLHPKKAIPTQQGGNHDPTRPIV